MCGLAVLGFSTFYAQTHIISTLCLCIKNGLRFGSVVERDRVSFFVIEAGAPRYFVGMSGSATITTVFAVFCL